MRYNLLSFVAALQLQLLSTLETNNFDFQGSRVRRVDWLKNGSLSTEQGSTSLRCEDDFIAHWCGIVSLDQIGRPAT